MTGPLFDVAGVTYRYQAVTALDGLSLRIEAASVLRCWARTDREVDALRLLDGLYFAESGSVTFRDTLSRAASTMMLRLRFPAQSATGVSESRCPALQSDVFDEIAFGPLQLRCAGRNFAARRGDAGCDGNWAFEGSPAASAIGWQKKRVALASVLGWIPKCCCWTSPLRRLTEEPEPDHRPADRLGRWPQDRDHRDSRLRAGGRHRRSLFHFPKRKSVAEGEPAALLRDQALLGSANLIHAHRHRHDSGKPTRTRTPIPIATNKELKPGLYTQTPILDPVFIENKSFSGDCRLGMVFKLLPGLRVFRYRVVTAGCYSTTS